MASDSLTQLHPASQADNKRQCARGARLSRNCGRVCSPSYLIVSRSLSLGRRHPNSSAIGRTPRALRVRPRGRALHYNYFPATTGSGSEPPSFPRSSSDDHYIPLVIKPPTQSASQKEKRRPLRVPSLIAVERRAASPRWPSTLTAGLEGDGWNGVCEDLSLTVRGSSFEDAKRKMEAALQRQMESVLRGHPRASRKKVA